MRIVEELCIGCEICIPYCSVGAIKPDDGLMVVDEELCVECGTCLRNSGCPTDAIYWPPEADAWPRSVRKAFSDPLTPHKSTGGKGRGTEEMKTNDVTGRYRRGEIGVALEFGRPGTATRLGEIEKMSTALAALGVEFEPVNPLTDLMADPKTGRLPEEVKNERVLSAIIEFKAPAARLAEIVPVVQKVAQGIDTVFSWCLISRVEPGGEIPVLPALQALGVRPRPNAKINMGLGRPLVDV